MLLGTGPALHLGQLCYILTWSGYILLFCGTSLCALFTVPKEVHLLNSGLPFVATSPTLLLVQMSLLEEHVLTLRLQFTLQEQKVTLAVREVGHQPV